MKMTNYYTENLADFGFREIKLLRDILDTWVESGSPDGFDNTEVKPAFNKGSGYVFLTNEEYQVAMLNDGDLELWHFTPYDGYEGFIDDLLQEHSPNDLHEDDVEYLLQYIKDASDAVPEAWQELVDKA